MVSKANRWKPQMTRAEAYRALAERLRAYAQKPEAADYVAEFRQLAKCYRLLAESAERKAQFALRPWYGHAEHFHVQVACPDDSPDCKPATPPRPSDGCDQELDFWFKESTLNPPPSKPKPPLTLAELPPACKQIVKAP